LCLAYISLRVNYTHQKKIEKQNEEIKELNNLYKEKTEDELKKNKMADLRLNIEEKIQKLSAGREIVFKRISLTNAGKCRADSIVISSTKDKGIIHQEECLKPGDKLILPLPPVGRFVDGENKAAVSWVDGLGPQKEIIEIH